jgi:hypothetical protein
MSAFLWGYRSRARSPASGDGCVVAPDCATRCPTCLVHLRRAAYGTLRVRAVSGYFLKGAA